MYRDFTADQWHGIRWNVVELSRTETDEYLIAEMAVFDACEEPVFHVAHGLMEEVRRMARWSVKQRKPNPAQAELRFAC